MEPRGLSALLALAYVGSVYMFPGARESFRDDVGVLGRRVIGVIIFTILGLAAYGNDWQRWVGIHGEVTVRPVVRAILLVHILYMAPLLVFGYPSLAFPRTEQGRLLWFRDYLVGPITEEIVYRGLIVSIYRKGGLSTQQALTENFMYFGFAHLHHAAMQWLGGGVSARNAITSSLVHFVITSLFGTYACFLLIRTGSIWPSVVSHVLCNFFGPPRLRGGPFWYAPTLVAGLGLWAYLLKYV